ncbi:MAG: hypothetical protein MUF00_01635 [Gemmatimonadaceae bacterium]|nr:hypothetical protein [Gemmatimonadaceae bacterium]
MAYTTTDLLAAVKRRAQLPDANGALSDDDILSLATIAQRTQIQPLIRSVREDYAVVSQTQALVSGQQQYPIPSRAEGGAVRDVWIRTTSTPTRDQQLVYIPPEDRPMFRDMRNPWWSTQAAYTVEGNDLWIAPIPDASMASQFTLVVRYVLRPGAFIAVSSCDQITSASLSGYLVSAGSVFVGGSEPATIDVIGRLPPFRPRVISTTYTVSGVGDVDVDFDDPTAVIESPVSGDYACPTDTTCVLTCPVEAHEALIAATLVHVYETLGYTGDLQSAVALRDAQMQAVRVLMEPRTEGASRAIIDPYSPLRRARRRGAW